MKTYLTNKYKREFVIEKTNYNYLSETYQSYAYPKQHASLLFLVQQDPNTKSGYSDTFPKVFWGSNLGDKMKAEIKKIYPNLDETTFKALQIIEKGEIFSPNIPSYEQIHASPLSCSIHIHIHANWQLLKQADEQKKILQLSHYLKSTHLPVLVEVRYYEFDPSNNEKVYFITEDGKIVKN